MAGIVGMGGAAFPAHVKLSVPDGVRIRHLLINGAECEPYLTTDHRLMLERPEALLEGAEIMRQKLGAEEAVIGIEANKPDAIEIVQKHIQPGAPVRVVPLKVKYPQGAEKMMIKSVFDVEVPAGQLPRDVEVNVNNVGTIVAIADYFLRGMPLIERVVTVAGPGVTYPANLIVPLGTPVRDVVKFCGGLKPGTREIVMGGPMMGRPIASLDVPDPERLLRRTGVYRRTDGQAQGVSVHQLRTLPGSLSVFSEPVPACTPVQVTHVRRDESLQRL